MVELDNIQEWTTNNRMALSMKKTYEIIFSERLMCLSTSGNYTQVEILTRKIHQRKNSSCQLPP